MPLDSAVYVSTTGKILGVLGPYVARFNATTGEREAIGKVAMPAAGPCAICFHAATGLVYVGVWNTAIGVYSTDYTTRPERDIFPVDPTTLAVGAGFNLMDGAMMSWSTYWPGQFLGPDILLSYGSLIYFDWVGGGRQYGRINPTAPAAFIGAPFANPRDTGSGINQFNIAQMAIDGTYLYGPNPFAPYVAERILLSSTTLARDNATNVTAGQTGIVTPVAVEYCAADGLVYTVCGNEWLCRVNSWGGTDYTAYNLDALITSGCSPFHIRYCDYVGHPFSGKLLIPCQENDRVIVWNPATGSGSLATGSFDGPIDVVFTPSKAFAVQSGLVSLKEIT